MPRWSLLALPLLLLGAPRLVEAKLDAAEWKVAESEFNRLWSPPPGKLGFESDKTSCVNLLIKDAEARSYKLLIDALVAECRLWHDAQTAVNAHVEKIAVTLTKPSKARTQPEETEMFRLQAELPKLEDDARIEKAVMAQLVKAIGDGPEALRTNLFSRAKGQADWTFRSAVAQVAAAQPIEKEAAAFLSRSLNPAGEKDPRVRAAALEGLAALPDGAEEHVLGRLADPDWGVQLRATTIVVEKKVTRAIPHLIAVLERATPRLQEPVGKALKELTGENFEAYADVWAKWWEANKAKFEGKEAVKVGARPKNPVADPTIYGVPIKSNRVLFILDVSGSMDKPASLKKPGEEPKKPQGPVTPKDGEPPPPPPPPPTPPELVNGLKIDVAKHELKQAIDKLPKDAYFSIIAYNHAALIWKEQPIEASAGNKQEAYKWVEGLKPSGSTFTDGALRLGFRMAGLGAIDKAYPEVSIDTIMLISDGAPTDNAPDASKNMDFNIILEHVREWNLQRRVVINCIAVDMQPGNEFMQKLAAENGGVFVDR